MKSLFCVLCLILLAACAPYKPPLDETQMVQGSSIVVPPDFNQLPKENEK